MGWFRQLKVPRVFYEMRAKIRLRQLEDSSRHQQPTTMITSEAKQQKL